MASVTIKNLKKIYNQVEVIHGIDLEIKDREFVVFVGPSGCGKSTLLRMIAGLEDISSGTISIGDNVVNDVSPAKRKVAMVFQTYALYPHMNVFDNMAFGLKQAKMPREEINERVNNIAKTLKITDYLDRLPKNLSGGQRQRVAIGRAIVREPSLFLFDEPLSNLDAALRVQTRVEIAKLHKKLNTTMIYVTHDQVEAMTLADKIVVLRDGNIEQVGKPIELYERPNNMFVAQFIGSPQINFFSKKDVIDSKLAMDDNLTIGIRPEHFNLCEKEDALVSARLDVIEQLGEYLLLHLHTENSTQFIVKTTQQLSEKDNAILYFNADLKHVHLFDTKTEQRIIDKTL